MKDAEPSCDDFTINFPWHSEDRRIEIDGLIKAKAILQGAKFDEGPYPSGKLNQVMLLCRCTCVADGSSTAARRT